MRKIAMAFAATLVLTSAASAQLAAIPGPFVGPGVPWGAGGGIFGAGPGIGNMTGMNVLSGAGLLGGLLGANEPGGYGGGPGLPPGYGSQQVIVAAPPPPVPMPTEVVQVNPRVVVIEQPIRRKARRVVNRAYQEETVEIIQQAPPVRVARGGYGTTCPSGQVPQPQAVYDNYGRWVGQRLICY